jgi:DNA-binding IclR family transcriptional regulator
VKPAAELQSMRGRVVSYVPQDPTAALNPALRIETQLLETLLAHGYGASDEERRARLDDVDLTRRGPNTITDRAALATELARVRRDGVAVNNEELAYGLRSIAVPVRSQSGEVVAAINLAVHRSFVSMKELVAHLGPVLKRAADEISAHLGYRASEG